MKKIVMFYGSDRAYAEIIPKSYRNLSDIAMQMDDENKQIPLVLGRINKHVLAGWGILA